MAHGDYTGNRKAMLAQQYHNQQQLAAQQMSLVTQVVQEDRKESIDLMTDEDYAALEHPTQVGEGGEVVEVDTVPEFLKPVKFRASETLEGITVGVDRHFSLEQGRVYQAPLWVVEHLDDKGLVWH